MTDLEMTKLCAEAMGYVPIKSTLQKKGETEAKYWKRKDGTEMMMSIYRPLHDDAQAMALVKRFKLDIHWQIAGAVYVCFENRPASIDGSGNLNRAIVQCVAKLQEGK